MLRPDGLLLFQEIVDLEVVRWLRREVLPVLQVGELHFFRDDERFDTVGLVDDLGFLDLCADLDGRAVEDRYLFAHLDEKVRDPVHMTGRQEVLNGANNAVLAFHRRRVSHGEDVVDVGRYPFPVGNGLEDYTRVLRHGQEDHSRFHPGMESHPVNDSAFSNGFLLFPGASRCHFQLEIRNRRIVP
ncbi:MAG: hypothetical protein A4E61_00410 [Syntrophorhabdus sp. PtaB.Bin184]|nr:MAG: hypothetical protein A4E61_00410 [Syntrophorhabdus sp. PtaB.Bin184]